MELKAGRYSALDGIRGFAAVMVFFYHYSLELFDPLALYSSFYAFRVSYAFVDFFFVLSGFVIAANYWTKVNNRATFKTFAMKRLIRLYPLLFFTVMIFVGLKLYAFLFTDFNFNSGEYSLNRLVLETIEPLTFMNSTPIITTDNGMNPVSWSISAEMIAYLAFAGLSVLIPNKRWPFVFLIIAGAAFFVYQGRYIYTGDFGFVRGIINFSSGVIVYCFYSTKRGDLKGAKLLEWCFLLILFVMLAIIEFSTNELWNLLLPVVFSFGVYAFAFESGAISKFLKTGLMQYLGSISYSLYLNHFIILWVFYQFVWNILRLEPSIVLSLFGGVVALLVSVLVSGFTYRYVELFFSRRLKKKFGFS